jgi:hypothetical protein
MRRLETRNIGEEVTSSSTAQVSLQNLQNLQGISNKAAGDKIRSKKLH